MNSLMLSQLKNKEHAKTFIGPGSTLRQIATSHIFDHDFPNALHYSYVVLLFIAIEDGLRKTCDFIQQSNTLPLKAKHLKGDAIERCMLFLDKLAGIPRSDLHHWHQVSDLSKVRHCVVHSSGRVALSRDKEYLLELVQKRPDHLKPSNHGNSEDKVLIVEHSYCILSTDDARNFFKEIFQKARIT